MIKFFRKIRQKLVTEEKFRKYLLYAIGEIILIMFGILLAVQIQEWNQEKKDRKEERLILSRLSSELKNNSDRLSSFFTGFERKEEALNLVSSVFKGKPVENDSIFLTVLITSSLWGWTVQPLQRLVFDEVNNTGRLVIVQNTELRETITELYSIIEVLEGTALARNSEYAKSLYALVPRENELQMLHSLSSREIESLVDDVLGSKLDQLIVFEQNRARYLKQIWNTLDNSIVEVNTRIEFELNE